MAEALLQIDTHAQAGEVLDKISSALATLNGQDDLHIAPTPSSLDQHLPQIQQIADQVKLSIDAAEEPHHTGKRDGYVAVILIAF